MENKYDLFITGNDQIWNLGRVNLDSTYLLDFVKNSQKGVKIVVLSYPGKGKNIKWLLSVGTQERMS